MAKQTYTCTGCNETKSYTTGNALKACTPDGEIIINEPKPKKPKKVWVLEMENEGVYGLFKSKTGAEAAMKLGQAQWPDDTFNCFKMHVEG